MKKAGNQDEGEVEWNPASGTLGTRDGAPLAHLGRTQKKNGLSLEEGDLWHLGIASPKRPSDMNEMGGSIDTFPNTSYDNRFPV